MSASAALLFLFWNPLMCVRGAWLLTGPPSISSNPSICRGHGATTKHQGHRHQRCRFAFTSTAAATINTAGTVSSTTSLKANDDKTSDASGPDIDSIKAQLTEYLAKRKEIGADELAKK
jgi:hypothetical protein